LSFKPCLSRLTASYIHPRSIFYMENIKLWATRDNAQTWIYVVLSTACKIRD
jgi:hypothetical protein